ncbi:hypothetical protein BGX29_002095 [Mortierella sp. GBA35]|nr:hypothetical protein BGX29_002095 [Mortierella sp. GBA35]
MICHLQRLTTTADYNNEATSQPQPPRELLPLQYDDLAQLQSFVVRRRTPITTADTDSGSPLLHRQYRVVNNQGHIQWICQFHIAQLYPTFDPEHVQRLFQGCYDYNPQNGQLVVFNRSTSFLSASHGPRILGTGCVSELTIDVRSGMSAKEFQSLRDAVVDFGLASLDIREFGYIAMSPLEVASPTSSPAANTADPYRRLQSYPSVSTVLWQLLSDHAIQSLSLRNASHLLAQDWARRPVCPFRLRRVWLTISTKGKGLNAVKQGILNILSHSPRLKDLKIVWDDLDEAIGEETLLKTLVAHASPDNKIKVSLAMAGWTTSLTIEKGQFVNASLRATNLAAVKQHSLALSGQLTGSLTITSMAIWGSTWPYILMYLSKNPRLASLDLQYPSEDFKKAEDVILEALLSGDNGPYHLRECILRDTRGKNDIRTRFTIPLSASLSVQRPMVSVSVAVDMVVVEKDSMDFDLFFSRYGHAVKSMVLARKTAPTLLASFDNATSTTIRTNPRSQLQFTNLVVSLTGMTTTSIFYLQRILERSKGTFKQLTLCGDVPPPSEFDDSMLLFHVLAGFVGEQVVLLKQSQGQGQGQGQATTMADQGRMQEWIDLVPFTLPKEAIFTVTEDKRDLCRIVSGLTMSIAEHL